MRDSGAAELRNPWGQGPDDSVELLSHLTAPGTPSHQGPNHKVVATALTLVCCWSLTISPLWLSTVELWTVLSWLVILRGPRTCLVHVSTACII